MKYEINELIFATKVRELAIAIRGEAAAKEKKEVERALTDDERQSAIAYALAHARQHPATEYVPEALTRIFATADAIRDFIKTQS